MCVCMCACVCVLRQIWMHPVKEELVAEGLTVPTLFTLSDQFHVWDENMSVLQSLFDKSRTRHIAHELMVLRGSRHSNFSDPALFSQFIARKIKQIGTIDFRLGLKLLNCIQLAFLAKHLSLDADHPAHKFRDYLDHAKAPNEFKFI